MPARPLLGGEQLRERLVGVDRVGRLADTRRRASRWRDGDRPGSTRSSGDRPGPATPPTTSPPPAAGSDRCGATRDRCACASPARRRAPSMISSSPSADNGSPAPRSLQHDEHPIRRRVLRALVVEVAADGGEEPVRHRHQPLMAALAVGDEHPPLPDPHIAEPQPEHLAAAQPAEHHRLDHRPVPLACAAPPTRRRPRPATGPSATSADRAPTAPSVTRPGPLADASSAPAAPGCASPTCRRGPPDRRRTPTPTTTAERSCAPTTPTRRSTSRTTVRSPRCAAMNSNTSADVTSTAPCSTTVKNVFRSNAVARTCSAGTAPRRTPDSDPPADHPARSGPHPTARPTGPSASVSDASAERSVSVRWALSVGRRERRRCTTQTGRPRAPGGRPAT